MSTQKKLERFNEIYNQTYENVLKYVVLHCSNLDDVNDLVQDTYLEVYKNLHKKKLNEVKDFNKYIIGICKNILKKYYRFKYKNNSVQSINYEEYAEQISLIDYDIDIELQILTRENVDYVWRYLKNKDIKIAQIFYLYYCLDMKINEISNEMQLNESTIKNYIYRTIKELKLDLREEE